MMIWTVWAPVIMLVVVMLAVVLPALIFGWRYVRLPRLLVAAGVTAIVQFAVLLYCTGFGWGWPDASETDLMIGRILLGASFGISGALFAWILTRRASSKIFAVLVLSNVALVMPGTIADEILYPVVGLVLFSGLCFWFRGTENPIEAETRDGKESRRSESASKYDVATCDAVQELSATAGVRSAKQSNDWRNGHCANNPPDQNENQPPTRPN